MCQYFWTSRLLGTQIDDRGFVFILCIVQVVGIKLKIQPIHSMSLSSWSFHVCHFKLRGGGVHGSTVAFWSCPGWQYVEKFRNSLNKITIIWQTHRLNTIIWLLLFMLETAFYRTKWRPFHFQSWWTTRLTFHTWRQTFNRRKIELSVVVV